MRDHDVFHLFYFIVFYVFVLNFSFCTHIPMSVVRYIINSKILSIPREIFHKIEVQGVSQ